MTSISSRNVSFLQALGGLALTLWMVILAVQQVNSAHDHHYAVRVVIMFATAACVAAWTVQRCAFLLRRQQ